MKNTILKGLAGIITAAVVALFIIPMSAQAAGEPQVSLTATWCEFNGSTFVIARNNGSIGDQVNNYTWNITEQAVRMDNASSVLNYTESRKAITDPIYVDTSRFGENQKVVVSIVMTCAELNYSYTVNFTVKNDQNIGGAINLVAPSSSVLCNGQSNNGTLDAYSNELGDLAKATVKAFIPAGYMYACDGAISFNYKLDYTNKNGVICLQLPEGIQASNRVYKILTIGEGGTIAYGDDLDSNPNTITANINFNGFAFSILYSETGAAPAGAPANVQNASGSVTGVTPAMMVLTNASFEEAPQGTQCMNSFAAFTPLGYREIKTYNLVLNGVNYNAKNGLVTLSVPRGFADYKLLTIDSKGMVTVLDDLDNVPGSATFAVNFNGYAVELIGR